MRVDSSGNLTIDTDTFVVDSVNNRVGIGTTTPRALLDIVGVASPNSHRFSQNSFIIDDTEGLMQFIADDSFSYAGGLIFTSAPASGNNKHWGLISGGPSVGNNFSFRYIITTGSTSVNAFNGAEIMTLTTQGNVGIGTTTPSARLHTVSTTEQLRLGYDASNYMSATVSSSGLVTLDAVGAGAGFEFSDNVVGNGTANQLPNQVITSASDVLTRDAALRDQMNNMWMPWMFTSFGRTGNRGTATTIPPILSMGTTNVYQDVLFISIALNSPFHPRGSGAPQRWATNFTFLFEMDANNQSTANKHLIIGKSPSTVYNTMLPSIGDRCIHVLWIGNNSLQLNLYYNDKVTSSDVVTIPSGLSDKEKYALVWDGTTLSIYGAFWLAWNPQPNLSLRATVSLEEASTNVNMTANEWTFAQTHENDGGLSNSSLAIYCPSFLRRALHPFT
jgi:hypothetical protein